MREEFMHVYANLIQRSGSNNLLDWIESRTTSLTLRRARDTIWQSLAVW